MGTNAKVIILLLLLLVFACGVLCELQSGILSSAARGLRAACLRCHTKSSEVSNDKRTEPALMLHRHNTRRPRATHQDHPGQARDGALTSSPSRRGASQKL